MRLEDFKYTTQDLSGATHQCVTESMENAIYKTASRLKEAGDGNKTILNLILDYIKTFIPEEKNADQLTVENISKFITKVITVFNDVNYVRDRLLGLSQETSTEGDNSELRQEAIDHIINILDPIFKKADTEAREHGLGQS